VKQGNPLVELFNTPRRVFTTVAITIMATVQVAGYNGLMIWLPSMLQKSHGFSVSGSAIWTISTIVGMVIGMLTFGVIMDRLGSRVSYGIFLVSSALAVFLYSFASSGIALLIGGAIVGFFANGMYAGYGALISNHYPTRMRSTATNTIFNLGRAVGGLSPILVGYLLQNYNMTTVMIYVACLYIVSLIVMLTLRVSTHEENSELAME
jgi:MFS family permease